MKKVFILSSILISIVALLFSPVHSKAQDANAASNAPKDYGKAMATFAKLDQSQNYTESLAYADMNVLPMGIKQTLSNIEVVIAVSDIRWLTTHSELTVFARVKIQQDKPLFFGAQGIKLSHDGSIIGDASLVLMGDVTIPINGNTAALTLKGNFDINTGSAKELTYVSMDCQGFREMGIQAEVAFPESLMSPVDEKGQVITGKRVSGKFHTIVKDWNDLLIDLSLPPFQINGLDGFIFSIQSAVFDFSDLRNDPNIQYPKGYEAAYLIPGNPTLWRGVYAKELKVTMPQQFASRQGSQRVSFLAQNMIIDNNGVSGLFSAVGILPIDQGTASGWRFSVDTFTLGLEANTLVSAGFSGLIGLPVADKSNLNYDAIISANGDYLLRVKSLGKTKFDVFNAQAELLPNSYVQLNVVDGQFKPEAMLHGSLNFAARIGSDTTGSKIADFNGIEFRSLHLKTDAPQLTAEYFGYKGEIKVMNFPISINEIGLRATDKEVALGIGINLTLSDNLFAASTRVEVVGALTGEGDGIQQWRYKHLDISKVSINAKIAETFTITGGLIILKDDPTYGDGFSGNIKIAFDKVLKGCTMETRAMFGKKDFRYWFVDGKIKFPGKGIPVFASVNLTGIGGGVSNRMKRDGIEMASSPTGARYVPDANTGIGVKAAVMFNVGSDAAVNGEASFEIAFNRSGGLNFIGFYGFAKFVGKIPGADNVEKFVGDKFNKVAELEKKFVGDNPAMAGTLEKLKQFEPNKASEKVFEPTVKPGEAGFSAAVGIQYDFSQNTLHATFDLYVNALNGLVRGTASGNRAGWAVMHIESKEWYIHMGTPTDRLGLKMGIGGISVETGSYLMLGSHIPASPPPPKEVAAILEVDISQLDYMRDLNALGEGRGFAFGSSLKIETGDITFLILYANFSAGLGFDIMLKDYGDAQCKGSSGKIGFDGWYANGQAYAYLQGELGIKVDLWFIKGKFPILSGAAAALIQAKLPNPSWFRGYLGVRFNILGGLVSGSCRFKFTIGDECELVIPGGSPVDVRMISDMSPHDKSKDVDVFTAPNVAFNMKVGVPFDVEDDSGTKTYRISLNELTVSDNGQPIAGVLDWNEGKDGVSFLSHEVLPPKKDLKATVKVGFEVWQNSKWNVVYTAGKLAQEIMEVNFTTGTAPDVIPIENVQFSHPVVAQQFFLKGESTNGVVQLKRGQSYLFTPDFQYQIHFTMPDGKRTEASFTYNSATNRIDYALPTLNNSQLYGFDVVLLNKNGTATAQVTEEKKDLGSDDDVITLTNKQAGAVIRSDVGKSLLNYQFTSSRYNTLSEKVAAVQKGSALAERLLSDVIDLQYAINGGEPFDITELSGTSFTDKNPLIEATATLSDDYYTQDMYPMLYQNYPVNGLTFARDVNALGVPPAKALPLSTAYLTEIENNNFNGLAKSRFPYIYNLPMAYKMDFVDMQNKVVNQVLGTPKQAQYNYIIAGYYKFIRFGYYKIRLQYMLPDGTKGTQGEFDYFNFIK